MACMAHTCNTCGEMWENNHMGGECPACGSTSVSSYFDEPYEDDEVAEIRSEIYDDLKLEVF